MSAHPTADGGQRRIEGLLLGIAAGDAAGWPSGRHRATRLPDWTRRLTRELDTFAEQNATTTLPVPIALNQPPDPLRLGPSDDAEWAAFTAQAVLSATVSGGSDLSTDQRVRSALALAWNALADEVAAAAEQAEEIESAHVPLRARISVRAGLGNLAAGLRPPATGHDNPHYFDDAACVRAAVLAVVHPGQPAAAADLAEFDARYTQDGDGVHGARAVAAAVAVALGGGPMESCVAAALRQLPAETEIRRNALRAVELGQAAAAARPGLPGNAFALVPVLEHEIVDHVYSYGIAAAETVPVALAVATAAAGAVTEAVPSAACLSRVADSAPALAGALTGVVGGAAALPASWRDACRTLAGCALPRLAGVDLVELATALESAPCLPDPAGAASADPAAGPAAGPTADPAAGPAGTQAVTADHLAASSEGLRA
ncbi:ADP-ribosylglycohydrolase family protein [Streptomyces sp. DSM 44915]|uniref:ADP-ribosylglycohydrolase family protein n=1 Tax=Streptomyces chisholmiae TaxID=3075540 RepID=A0ABU2JNB0_9ACTN|nr:ADP-ribosylglycohydrolase family protein [Streptomyces sp. DSM 44915]MDT0266485.1 ADP-ribosylglycohydrolase family protein [Streptomyces sp. DSM 44915]